MEMKIRVVKGSIWVHTPHGRAVVGQATREHAPTWIRRSLRSGVSATRVVTPWGEKWVATRPDAVQWVRDTITASTLTIIDNPVETFATRPEQTKAVVAAMRQHAIPTEVRKVQRRGADGRRAVVTTTRVVGPVLAIALEQAVSVLEGEGIEPDVVACEAGGGGTK